MKADLELLRRVASATAGFAVEVDERAEAVGFAADDGDHQGKSQRAGADKGCGRSADAQPDGQRILQRARVDALAGERGAMFAGPMDMGVLADIQQQVELLGEERVVVFEVETEERERLDERAAAGDDFGAAVGDEVERGEFLEDADWIGGAEDGDGAGKADAFGAARRRRRG